MQIKTRKIKSNMCQSRSRASTRIILESITCYLPVAIPVSCYCRALGPPVCPRNGRSRRGFRSTGRNDGRRNQSAGCS